MIERLSVKNFKGLTDFRIEPLAQITLLGGENSVGKSTILESVFMFFDRTNPELVLRQYSWRGLSKTYLSVDQLFAPIFHDYSMKKEITISPTIDGQDERLRITYSEKLPERRIVIERKDPRRVIRTDDKPIVHGKLILNYSRGGQTERSSLVVTAKGLTMRDDDSVKPELRPAVYISPRVPSSPAEDAQRFGELDVRGEVDSAVEFLKQFDDRIRGLSSIFYGDSSVIHADIGLSRKVPIPQLGEGLSSLLSLFLAISMGKNGVVLIDEIGTGIHHSILPKFWSEMAKATDRFRCQIIATTHSYECMQAASAGLRETPSKFRYFRLERDRGEVETVAYEFPVFDAAIESGWEVR